VVVITGTNGKSTTTALVAHLLSAAGKRVALGGNIGNAVLDLDPFAPDLTYVIELSSFQIELAPGLRPDAAALLNITPDHLDRHGTLRNYARIKSAIFARLGAGATAVVGVDDAPSRDIADHLAGPFAVKRIAVGHPVETGVSVEEGVLREMEGGGEAARIDLAGIGSLRGAHNWQNAAVAYALSRAQGLASDAIAQGLKSFAGLSHRMEQVARRGKVLFVNDSKATNADAAGKALASFTDIYWIIGGRPKEGGLAGLEPFFPRIARAYLIGEAAEAFGRQLGDAVDHVYCGTLDRAVAAAADDAGRSGAKEPVVLLSPACASYDQFDNFAKRGDAFRDMVMSLDGAEGVKPERGQAA
jgi:UDP-N-acetylmuramoylalanine--D-glutamate ligase